MLAAILAGLGCEQTFDPKGTFEPALAVFSVLRTTTDTVSVRVHTTYNPVGFDPLERTTETDLSGALVTLQSASESLVLSDTLIPHPDPSRYGDFLRVFSRHPWMATRGGVYTLTVSSPGYPTVSATTSVPKGPSQFYLTNSVLLNSPRSFSNLDINVLFKAPPEAKGYLVRLVVEFELLSPPGSVRRAEIPVRIYESEGTIASIFPSISTLSASSDVVTYASFRISAYVHAIAALISEYGVSNIRFRKAVVYLNLLDEPLYTYYSIVNGFRDEFSIRTDLPDYSNVTGGVGVFGSISLDSIQIPMNPSIQF